MSTYRGVNFHNLCRVCTSHSEQRISIFSADGKSKNLCAKIAESLSLMVDEKDRLPKVVCVTCLEQIEEIYKFRNICKNSQNMLSDCLKQATQQRSGKVYIKDVIATNTGKSLSVMCNNATNNRLNVQSAVDVNNTTQYPVITSQQNFSNLGTISNNSSDILNSIMQSIGIPQTTVANPVGKHLMQEYTITVDNKGALKTEPLHYKCDATSVVTTLQNPQSAQQQKSSLSSESDHKSLTEFLKTKPNIKVTPLGKNNNKNRDDQQQNSQLHLQSSQIIQQQEQNNNSNNSQHMHMNIQQQLPLSQSTTAAANLQLQQLQQQLQQFQLQQQLQQQIQQITSQLQPQSTITLGAPSTPLEETSPSKSKKPKLNFVLTSPTSQTITASLPQLAMNAGTQPPQIQLQFQAPQTQSQATAATLLSNLAPFLQQQSPQTHNSASILQTPTSSTTPATLMTSPNKCYLPITIKDENSDQQIVAHIDAKNFMLPTTYQLQMKLQPQIATVDGQPIMQLTPTSIPATLQLASSALNNQSFPTITGNMMQTIPSTMQSPPQQQQQQTPAQQLLMKQTSLLKQAAQVTSQQIIRPASHFTNDVATSTNDQIEDFVPNKIDNNKQFPNEVDKVIKQQKYRLSQQVDSGVIEITPTTNFTQQIMQQVQKHQQQQQQTQQQQTQQKPCQQQQQKQLHSQEPQKNEQQLQAQKQLQDVVTSLNTQSPNSVTVHRVTNKSTTQSQQQSQLSQQPQSNAPIQTKIPMLQKKDVTISRISNTAQTQQQQQEQQQALLKLLPTSKLDVRTKNTCATGTQMQQRQPHLQLQSKQQDSQSQKNQTPNDPSLQKNARKSDKNLSVQPQVQLHSQTQPLLNIVDGTAITAGLPHQQHPSANITESDDTVKVKTEGVVAHGIGPNGLECSQCGRVFKKKEHLTQHVKLHAGLRPFKCKEEQCGKAFSRKEHLMRHEISHSGRKLFSCDVCHKPFSRKDNLNKHRRIHTTGTSIYNCETCNKQFAVKAYYEEHKQMHENESEPAAIENTNQKDEKTINGPNTINTDVSVQNSQDANRQQQQQQAPHLLQSPQQQQTQLFQSTQPQQTQLLTQSQQHQQQTNLLQHSQQQQHALTNIPPSLMSTHQPTQTQHIQIVQHQGGNTQFQQQQQHIMQLQLPAVVGTQDLAGNTITITQSHNPTLKATIGSHDATVLNLPSSLANLMQLSHAQFVNPATGQIMGHIKIEK